MSEESGAAPAEGVAQEWVETAAEPEPRAPSEISDKVSLEPKTQTEHRVSVWLAETRYLISTLEHEVTGGAGEIIAYLRARL
jgi:hypothetical protein